AFDIRYAEALGIDANLLLVSQPDNGEQALEICETLIRSGAVDLVVLDSVAALVPKAEIEGEMGDHHMGLQARLMSQAMRKLTGIISRTGCALILINQLRQKIGVVFGNPEVTTGGNALKFYSSIRIEVRRIGSLKSNGETNGHRTRVRIVKNKMAPPFRDAEVDMIYGRGIVRSLELIDLALSEDILQRSGNWISFDSVRLGQGRDKASRFLESNSEIMKEVEVKLMGDTPEDSPNQPEKKKRQKAA
ncbi:MAG: recombinase RecA, partial [Myxococcota bacterium]|nr:recombinase RecA [Myxococcota bacterium]